MSNTITFIVVVGYTPELDYELWSFIVILLFWNILAAGVDIKKDVSRNN